MGDSLTKAEILKILHFDQGSIVLNPYFFGNKGEEKGSLILMKTKQGTNFDYLDIENLCFQCPPLENHESLIRMVIFLFDKNDLIYDYTVAASKYKISRSDILKFEKIIGVKLTRGEKKNA